MEVRHHATTTSSGQLWCVVRGGPQVDPRRLANAIVDALREGVLDFRSRLLVRDSVEALRRYWGRDRLEEWLGATGIAAAVGEILSYDFEEVGFPSLEKRLMESTDRPTVLEFLRELSLHVQTPVKLYVGGSVALILADRLSRSTEDIDVVDEVPAELRHQHQVLDDLAKRYLLRLTRFPSRYLPDGWQSRVQSLDTFGTLQVFVVDPYDVFLSKLFSLRTKDRDDLRVLRPTLDKAQLTGRLQASTAALRADQRLRSAAEQNWFILFGETLRRDHYDCWGSHTPRATTRIASAAASAR